ncbi:MAG: hypothetical protein VCD00_18340 [Candidatus Hydrogenedentota bacterium]
MTIFSVPIYQNVLEGEGRLAGPSVRVDRVLPSGAALRAVSVAIVLDETIGRMEGYEDTLEQDSWLRAALLPGMNRTLSRFRNDMNEQLYLGQRDWMFYRPSIDHVTGPGFLEPGILRARAITEGVESDPLAAMVEFRDRLAARGVELLVVPVPTKAGVYPEEFSAAFPAEEGGLQNVSFAAYLERMAEHGIYAVDVLPDLINAKEEVSKPLYLATDSHWSPEGMRVAADTIADYVRTHDLIPVSDPVSFRVNEQMGFRGSGDLVRMLDRRDDETLFLDLRWRGRIQAERTITPRKLFYTSGAAWTEDESASVLVLGDSFSRIYSDPSLGWGRGMGLVEQLSYNLGVAMDGIRINDQGAYATRETLSRDIQAGDDRLRGKKLVIWEFSTRELSFGDWRTGYEYAPRVVPTNDYAGDAVVARGVIESITRPPAPNETPYPNGLISIHLRDVVVAGSTSFPSGVVVFAWGMQEHKHTEAATYARGQEVMVQLQPWLSTRDSLGSFSRSDFDDLSLLRLDAFYGEFLEAGSTVESNPASVQENRGSASVIGNAESLVAERMRTSTGEVESAFMEAVSRQEKIGYTGALDMVGRDGWYLLRHSAKALLSGTFFAPTATEWHSRLVEPNVISAIADYSEVLRARGVELILMPAPSKLFFHADSILMTDSFTNLDDSVRLDRKYAELYALLREREVNVLDLYPELTRRIGEADELIYRKDDHHWSSYGYREIADIINRHVGGDKLFSAVSKRNYVIREEQAVDKGSHWSQAVLAPESDILKPENQDFLTDVLAVKELKDDGTLINVEPWRASPVLIIGDSFVTHLSRSENDFGAGLVDQLAGVLGFPIDSIGVAAGGANEARVELALDAGRLNGKKVLIWCFRSEELVYATSGNGWLKVPLPKTVDR